MPRRFVLAQERADARADVERAALELLVAQEERDRFQHSLNESFQEHSFVWHLFEEG